MSRMEIWNAVSLMVLSCGLASAQTITSFDAPGCHGTFFFCTAPLAINQAGTVTGFYNDANNVEHGFLRAIDGTITTFDAPGAQFTSPTSINSLGEITGTYCDTTGCHGFLRAPDGEISSFDPESSASTSPFAINSAGTSVPE